MSNKSLIVNHLGKQYTGKIATIKKTYLGNGDDSRGIMSTNLFCEWEHGGIAVGGWSLDNYDKSMQRRVGTDFGLDFIMNILEVAGVESWEQLKGTKVVVLFDMGHSGAGSQAIGFAGLENDKVFIHEEFHEYWEAIRADKC